MWRIETCAVTRLRAQCSVQVATSLKIDPAPMLRAQKHARSIDHQSCVLNLQELPTIPDLYLGSGRPFPRDTRAPAGAARPRRHRTRRASPSAARRRTVQYTPRPAAPCAFAARTPIEPRKLLGQRAPPRTPPCLIDEPSARSVLPLALCVCRPIGHDSAHAARCPLSLPIALPPIGVDSVAASTSIDCL